MLRRSVFSVLLLGLAAGAAHGQTAGMLSFQGLIKDAGGNPISGTVDLEFRIFDAETFGNLVDMNGDGVFDDVTIVLGVTVTDGILSAKFGPVHPKAFDGNDRWLEVSVDGSPLSRIEMATAPATAERLNRPGTGTPAITVNDVTGTVEVNGSMFVNGRNLHLAGPDFTMAFPERGDGGLALVHDGEPGVFEKLVINWKNSFEDGVQVQSDLEVAGTLDIRGTPAIDGVKFPDGTLQTTAFTGTDTLGALACASGEVAKWNGAAWACAPDVDTDTNTDTLGALACADGQIAKFSTVTAQWECAEDTDTDTDSLGALACADGQIAKFNTSTAQWECAEDIDTDTDTDTLGALACASGEVAKSNGSTWTCAADSDTDTLAGLTCAGSEVAKWNNGTSQWDCAADETGSGVPPGYSILGETTAAPSGYTYADAWVTPTGPGFDAWFQKTNIPSPFFNHVVVEVNGRVYITGSTVSSSAVTYEYDPATDFWTQKANRNYSTTYCAGAELNGKMYVTGGSNAPYCNEYDPVTNTWALKANIPLSMNYHASTSVNGKLYVMGGTTYGGTMMYEYDPSADTWVPKTSMGTPRYRLASVGLDGYIYAMGGTDFSGGSYADTVERYDPASDTWLYLPAMLVGRYDLAAASANGRIYASGGIDAASQRNVNEEYDPVIGEWVLLKPMPVPAYGHKATAVDGKIFSVGGWGPSYYLNWEYTPPARLYVHRKD